MIKASRSATSDEVYLGIYKPSSLRGRFAFIVTRSSRLVLSGIYLTQQLARQHANLLTISRVQCYKIHTQLDWKPLDNVWT